MSTPDLLCVDCFDFGVITDVKAPKIRCAAHRAAYRRWYKSVWKARQRGSASANRPYVPDVVAVEQVVVSGDVIRVLDDVARSLRISARDLALHRGSAGDRVAEARVEVAQSSRRIDELLRVLKRAMVTR